MHGFSGAKSGVPDILDGGPSSVADFSLETRDRILQPDKLEAGMTGMVNVRVLQ